MLRGKKIRCYFSIQVQWCTEVFWLQFQVWLIYSLISCSLISYLVYYKNSFKSIFKDFVLRKLAMSWVRNVNFSENFAYVLNKWSPVIMDVSEHHYYLLLFKNYKFAGRSKPLSILLIRLYWQILPRFIQLGFKWVDGLDMYDIFFGAHSKFWSFRSTKKLEKKA